MSSEWREQDSDGTRTTRLRSNVLDQEFEIKVSVFAPKGEAGPFPALYVPDGNLFFGAVAKMVEVAQFTRRVPPMAVVGINYPIESIFADREARATFGNLRNRHLYPFNLADVPSDRKSPTVPATSGLEAPAFLRFLEGEVMPLVEGSFPIDPSDRGLIGHSAGAVFALYALLTTPALFSHVIATSPGSWPETFDGLAADWTSDRVTRVFTSMGARETDRAELWLEILDRLQSIESKQLHASGQSFADEDHGSVWAAAFARGLSETYPKDS